MPTQTVSNLIKSKFVEAACTNILRLFVLNLMLVNALTSASSRDNSNKLNGGGKALGAPGERSTAEPARDHQQPDRPAEKACADVIARRIRHAKCPVRVALSLCRHSPFCPVRRVFVVARILTGLRRRWPGLDLAAARLGSQRQRSRPRTVRDVLP
jgi:hypothetical protein